MICQHSRIGAVQLAHAALEHGVDIFPGHPGQCSPPWVPFVMSTDCPPISHHFGLQSTVSPLFTAPTLPARAAILTTYQAFEDQPGFAAAASTADALAAEGNLSIARYVKKPKAEVPAGEAVTLAAAWGAFDAEGRDFWIGMDALVDMLDGLPPAQDADV